MPAPAISAEIGWRPMPRNDERAPAPDPRHPAHRPRPGEPFPLGATWDRRGANFSVFSEVATRVELCLFDASGRESRIDLPDRTAFCWNGYVSGVEPGQQYGYRVHGPWNPAQGDRCNPNKLLIDPYAKSIAGDVLWDDAVFPYPLGGDAMAMNDDDTLPFVPRSVVVDPRFDWGDDQPLRRPLHETIIYEV